MAECISKKIFFRAIKEYEPVFCLHQTLMPLSDRYSPPNFAVTVETSPLTPVKSKFWVLPVARRIEFQACLWLSIKEDLVKTPDLPVAKATKRLY